MYLKKIHPKKRSKILKYIFFSFLFSFVLLQNFFFVIFFLFRHLRRFHSILESRGGPLSMLEEDERKMNKERNYLFLTMDTQQAPASKSFPKDCIHLMRENSEDNRCQCGGNTPILSPGWIVREKGRGQSWDVNSVHLDGLCGR